MFATLLESRARRVRRTGGGLVSLALHLGALATLVVVTARAATPPAHEDREVPVQMTDLPEPTPTPPAPRDAATPRVYRDAAPALGTPALIAPIEIPNAIPDIDLSRPVTDERDFATGRRGVTAAQGGVPGGTGLTPAAGYFFEGQVEKVAMVLPGQPGPTFPDLLRSAGIEGQVLAQFVVDSTGRAQLATFTALQSDHALFTAAVKASLSRVRYLPAEVGGKPVPQLVQQVFQFTLNR